MGAAAGLEISAETRAFSSPIIADDIKSWEVLLGCGWKLLAIVRI
jgi:hypothetical protein